VGSISYDYVERSPWSRGMVDTADAAYPVSRGFLIEHYMHLPHGASRLEWSLLLKVERNVVVAKN
jgi:hypothetical protein